jgi:hypothetical protein
MNVSFSEIKIISMSGYNAQARIYPEDCISIGDDQFIRVRPYGGYSMNSMVRESNDQAPEMKRPSLTACKGFDIIMRKRNDASFSDNAQITPRCTLFASNPDDAEPPAKKGKKAHKPRDQIKQERSDEPVAIAIDIEVDDQIISIDVLKAVQHHDALFVKYDAEMMGYFIKFLRDQGFNEPKRHDAELPAGIYRRQCTTADELVVATAKAPDGKLKYKTGTIDEAMEWQARMAVGDVDADALDYVANAENDD